MTEREQTTRTALPRNRRVSPSLQVGDKLGRFSVLSLLGVGGMGRVYEAYDSELDRRVALKLLRDVGAAGDHQRLLREAQALARLGHPNVVGVHDVGVHAGTLFVAMEFVGGGTLKDWSVANPPSSQQRFEEAIRLLVDAGRGLVAAHRAGLVHRDVKPSNILIGSDGRAQVADFGISRTVSTPGSRSVEPDATVSTEGELLSVDDTGEPLTHTGALMGTPAYMAPEQTGTSDVSAAADQFSYCVMAWELLFGVRPFRGTTRERRAAIRRGELHRPTEVEADVEVVALLRRGLNYRPSARHRDLKRLVDALARAGGLVPRMRQRFPWRWSLAAVGVAAAGAGVAYDAGKSEQLCTGAWASFEEAWNDEQRAGLRAKILGSGFDFAPGAWERIEAGIDAYGEVWRAAHTEACEATRVRGERSPEQMEETFACLRDAKRSVSAIIEVASAAEAGSLSNDGALLGGLRAVEECVGSRELAKPSEWGTLEEVARAAALRNAGHSRRAFLLVEPLALQLTKGTSPVVRARVLLEYGRGLTDTDPRHALEVLEESYSVAHAVREHATAAAAAAELAQAHVRLRGKADVVRDWLQLAKSERAPATAGERSKLLGLRGELLVLEGRQEEAIAAFEEAVSVAERHGTRAPYAHRKLAVHLLDVDTARALDAGQHALERFQDEFGVDHPGLAAFEETLAVALAARGRRDEAYEVAERALRRARAVWGSEHVATSRYLARLATLSCERSNEGGVELAKRAVALHAASTVSPARFDALVALQHCVEAGSPEQALAVSKQVYLLSHQLYGEGHFGTTRARAAYAQALLGASEVAVARRQLDGAIRLAREGTAGWNRRDAVEVHARLARVSSDLQIESEPGSQGGASLAYAREFPSDASPDQRVVDRCVTRRVFGDLEAALDECQAAHGVTSQRNRPLDYARVEFELCTVLRLLGRGADALPHARAAKRVFADLHGDKSFYLALATIELGLVYEGLEQTSAAQREFERGVALTRAFPGSARLQLEAGLGIVRTTARRGDPVTALVRLREVEALAGRRSLIDRGRILETQGFVEYTRASDEAPGLYRRALEDYRFSHDFGRIRWLCRTAPFQVSGCSGL